jgi:hypothetical protein
MISAEQIEREKELARAHRAWLRFRNKLRKRRRMLAERRRKIAGHGVTKAVYLAWAGAVSRCHDRQNKSYRSYGGRGIAVCEEWREDPRAFAEHIGPKPSPQHSLDRIDNDRGYEPGNVRWATREQQENNKQRSHRITWQGRTQTVAQWARELGVKYHNISDRLKRGWSVERALSTPITRGPHAASKK